MNKRKAEFKDFLDFERFTGADYLEAKHLLSWSSDKTGIWLKSCDTGEKKQITAHGVGEGNPVFSPDGTKLLFLSMIPDKGRQIFIYDLESENVEQITEIHGMVMEPLWSPDGRKILFASPGSTGAVENSSENSSQETICIVPDADLGKEDEAVVIEDFGYKFDGVGYYRPDSHMQLWVVSIEEKTCVCITDGQTDYMHHNWMPDGEHVVCVSSRFHSREDSLGMDLILIEAKAQGEMQQLTNRLWAVSYPNPIRPVPEPDGKSVIMGFLQEMKPGDDTYPEVYLYRVHIKEHAINEMECVFEPDEDCYQCVQFPYNAFCGWGFDKLQISPDGSSVFFLSGWQGKCCLYQLSLKNTPNYAKTVLKGNYVVNGIGKVQNDSLLLAISEPDMPEYYCLLDLKTHMLSEKLVQSAEELVKEVQFSKSEEFSVPTLDGDSNVHGWVLPPVNSEPGKQYPAILYIHGGPHPFYTYGFTLEMQCFAAAGFAVIYCNPRGTSGYGMNHQLLEKSMDGRAYMDLLQFVQEACRRYSFIDEKRLGTTGGSYGGYMVNYLATHAKCFQAYVTQRSSSNEMIMYASSDMQGQSKQYDNFEEFMLRAIQDSTVSYAEKIEKPFLILHGQDDYRTPVEGAHQLFVAIKDTHPDLPVKLVIYPHLNHDQPQDKMQLMHYYNEMTSWFKKYL